MSNHVMDDIVNGKGLQPLPHQESSKFYCESDLLFELEKEKKRRYKAEMELADLKSRLKTYCFSIVFVNEMFRFMKRDDAIEFTKEKAAKRLIGDLINMGVIKTGVEDYDGSNETLIKSTITILSDADEMR